jgi:hypothetical protein
MSADRENRITEFRRSQPEAELERKWNKARGRHSNSFYIMEWLDLAWVRAEALYQRIQACSRLPAAPQGEQSDV